MSGKPKLTMTNGAPVPDNQNVLTAGPRGPMLLQDVWFLEKLAHFDRESHQKGLNKAIEKGDFPRWDFKVLIRNCMKADPADDKEVAAALGISSGELG